jgi:hypothetical protein
MLWGGGLGLGRQDFHATATAMLEKMVGAGQASGPWFVLDAAVCTRSSNPLCPWFPHVGSPDASQTLFRPRSCAECLGLGGSLRAITARNALDPDCGERVWVLQSHVSAYCTSGRLRGPKTSARFSHQHRLTFGASPRGHGTERYRDCPSRTRASMRAVSTFYRLAPTRLASLRREGLPERRSEPLHRQLCLALPLAASQRLTDGAPLRFTVDTRIPVGRISRVNGVEGEWVNPGSPTLALTYS